MAQRVFHVSLGQAIIEEQDFALTIADGHGDPLEFCEHDIEGGFVIEADGTQRELRKDEFHVRRDTDGNIIGDGCNE